MATTITITARTQKDSSVKAHFTAMGTSTTLRFDESGKFYGMRRGSAALFGMKPEVFNRFRALVDVYEGRQVVEKMGVEIHENERQRIIDHYVVDDAIGIYLIEQAPGTGPLTFTIEAEDVIQ